MANSNSDYSIRGIITASSVEACAVDYDCIDLLSRVKPNPDRTFTYCGTGPTARLLSVDEGAPVPGTATFRGPCDDMEDTFFEFEENPKCPFWFQVYDCDGKTYHYSGVYAGNNSSVNNVTSQGPDAVSAACVNDLTIQFRRILRILPPQDVPLGRFVSSEGYYELDPLLGNANGTNVYFTIDNTPLDGFPLTIFVNGVEQTLTTDYTISGSNVTFVVAPACDDILLITYYSEIYAVYGLCPVAAVFCSDTCERDRTCQTCGDVYAIYETSQLVSPDVCGNTDGNQTAVVRWDYDSSDGTLTVDSITLSETIIGVNDAICSNTGELIIAADSGLYEGCGTTFVSVNNSGLPAGSVVRKLAFDQDTKEIWGLYGSSGILKRKRSGIWTISLTDNSITTEVQADIAASSSTVATVGAANTVQITKNGGVTWLLQNGPGTAGYNLLGVAVGPTQAVNDSRVLLEVVAADPDVDQTYFYVSDSYAVSWSDVRKTWAFIPTNDVHMCAYEDWFITVQLDDELWRNINRGCDKCGSWELLDDSGLLCTVMTCCPDDPNRMSIFSRPSEAAVPDFGLMSGTLAVVSTYDVTANDYTEVTGASIDSATLLVVDVSTNIAGSVTTAIVGGQIEVTVTTAVATGTRGYITYTVETTDGTLLTGLLVIDFLA